MDLSFLTWVNFALFGWLVALVLWGMLFIWWFRPKTDLRKVAEELFWVVEQIDIVSQGAVKGEDKWTIYRNLLLLVARLVGHYATEHVDTLGKEVVTGLSERKIQTPEVEHHDHRPEPRL